MIHRYVRGTSSGPDRLTRLLTRELVVIDDDSTVDEGVVIATCPLHEATRTKGEIIARTPGAYNARLSKSMTLISA